MPYGVRSTTMTRKNANRTNPTVRPTDLMPMRKALELLDIKASTFGVAVKRHDYLRNAIVRETHPETGALWTQVSRSAVDRYMSERKSGGTDGSHPGQLKHTTFLSEA